MCMDNSWYHIMQQSTEQNRIEQNRAKTIEHRCYLYSGDRVTDISYI